MILSVIIALCLLNYQKLIMYVIEVLGKHNVNSRTLNLIIGSKAFYDSGRNEIYSKLLYELNKSPFLGLGAFGGEATVGLTHSLYLDIFANLGYFFGTCFILYISAKGFKILKLERKTTYAIFLLILIIMVFPRGFFSESLWGCKELWMIIGMYLAYPKVRKSKQES